MFFSRIEWIIFTLGMAVAFAGVAFVAFVLAVPLWLALLSLSLSLLLFGAGIYFLIWYYGPEEVKPSPKPKRRSSPVHSYYDHPIVPLEPRPLEPPPPPR